MSPDAVVEMVEDAESKYGNSKDRYVAVLQVFDKEFLNDSDPRNDRWHVADQVPENMSAQKFAEDILCKMYAYSKRFGKPPMDDKDELQRWRAKLYACTVYGKAHGRAL